MESANQPARMTEKHRAVQASAAATNQPAPTLDDRQADLFRLKHERAMLYTQDDDLALQIYAARKVFIRAGLASDGWTGNLRGSQLEWTTMERLVAAIAAEESSIVALEKEQLEIRRDVFREYAKIMTRMRAAPTSPIADAKKQALVDLRLRLDVADARIVTAYGGLKPLHEKLLKAKTRRAANSDYCGAVLAAHARVVELERARSSIKLGLADAGLHIAIVGSTLTTGRLSSLQQAIERIEAMGRAVAAREAKQ